jgi:hypothetical protein
MYWWAPGGLALARLGRTLVSKQQDIAMSITFKLEIDGIAEALNVSNGNAAALLALAGLPSAPYGEVAHERLEPVVTSLLRVVNAESCRTSALAAGVETLRWSEGARTDEYVQRRAGELLGLLVTARRLGCGFTWG